MNTSRYATNPVDFMAYDTHRLRTTFLIENLFQDDVIVNTYSHYDRLIVGGAKPVSKSLTLEPFTELKADYYLQRRELGIINVGATGTITADGKVYTLKYKEALYIGKDTREVTFHPSTEGTALYYFNSAPAHTSYPTRLVTHADADTVELGSLETSNHRTIRKLIVASVLQVCQLQMGLTELKTGSVWNTMPAHTHDRRMEAYFYFEVKENQMVCHFMGQPQETRHIWIKNNQAVLSPPWSIHSGAGTSNYSFIWGMAGENLDYSDMDAVKVTDMK
ncbi:MAG TPA: 5-dehydro-4-deoxy-D-glucuronate isomerase [Ohtaekwangia sp.]|nr:5-dehydro-4-deoxy-D-glucuronate isomerase [Ohtaekwangia sp.]